MMDSDTIKFIRDEVKRQLQIILHGASGTNTVESEDIEQMYPGMPTINKRPVMHPYGVASRAPKGTIQVIGQVGDHPGNKFVMGHRDAGRPAGLKEGETAVYTKFGHQMQFQEKQVVLVHKDGATITLNEKGSIIVSAKDGGYIFLNAEKNEVSMVSKDGNVLALKPDGFLLADKTGKQMVSSDGEGKVQVVADKDVVVAAGKVTLQAGSVNIGDPAAFSAVLGEPLLSLFNAHVHPKGPGAAPNVGPPLTPMTPATHLASFVKLKGNT